MKLLKNIGIGVLYWILSITWLCVLYSWMDNMSWADIANKTFSQWIKPGKVFKAEYNLDNWNCELVQVIDIDSHDGLEGVPTEGTTSAVFIHSGGYMEQEIPKPLEKKIKFKACAAGQTGSHDLVGPASLALTPL